MFHKIIKIYLLSFLIISTSAAQQNETEFVIKASMIKKIVFFIEWPADAFKADNHFKIAVLGDHPINPILTKVYQDQSIKNMPVKITFIKTVDEIPDCNLLFISSDFEKSIPKILDIVKQKSILFMSDTDGFAALGSQINFYDDSNRIRFEINPDSFINSKLNVNYRLLSLAKIISKTEEVE